MIDPATGIDTDQVTWLHNQSWQKMPHKYFLTNNINQEYRKQGPAVRNVEQKKLSEELQQGNTITVNKITFKLLPKHNNETVPCVEACACSL